MRFFCFCLLNIFAALIYADNCIEGFFKVGDVVFEYIPPSDTLPSLKKVQEYEISLVTLDGGYDLARNGSGKRVKIKDLKYLSTKKGFTVEVLNGIADKAVHYLNEQGIVGVMVKLESGQIVNGQDKRVRSKRLRYAVELVKIVQVKTTKDGEYIRNGEWLDEHINRYSPILPYGDNAFLKKEKLNDYLVKLNRNHYRRYQAILEEDRGKQGFILNYLVNEDKPWVVYTNVMNTGTRDTRKMNESFGIINTQFTNHNDEIMLTYFTSSFKTINAGSLTYKYPFSDDSYVKVSGIYNHYNSSYFAIDGTEFISVEKDLALEVGSNVLQRGDLFLDVLGSLRYENIKVINRMQPANRMKQTSNFLLPLVGVKMEKLNASVSLRSDVSLIYNAAGMANTASAEALSNFGREDVNRRWLLLLWHFYSSFYFDAFNLDSTSYCPHEMVISFDGQYAFNYFRLIPQQRAVYGGFFTVRGYPESIAAGDTAINIRTQYGYHLGRFYANHRGKMPKWDMIPHTFLDYGYLSNSRKLSYEMNHNLVGLGCGMDFKYKNNLTVTSDVGIAMNRFYDINNTKNTTSFGSAKFHFIATLLY